MLDAVAERSTASRLTIKRTLQMYLCKTSKVSAEKRALAWLRKLIHPYCWGTSDRFKESFTQTSKAQILDFFLCLRFGIAKAVPADAQEPGLHAAFHRVSHPLLSGVTEGARPLRPWS